MKLLGAESQRVEDNLREEVARGQLVRGNSPWGSWAFPVAAHPAGKKRRIVVDYRRVNSRTIRAVYYLRTADTVKGECVGSVFCSLLDAVAGFNQLRNSPRAQRVLAVLAPSGSYLPKCLNFGPMNGPEDFARVVATLFALGKSRVRRLNKEWNVYVDDFCVRTGRWRGNRGYSDEEYSRMEAAAAIAGAPLRPVLVEAELRTMRKETEGEEGASGLGVTASACSAGDGPAQSLPTPNVGSVWTKDQEIEEIDVTPLIDKNTNCCCWLGGAEVGSGIKGVTDSFVIWLGGKLKKGVPGNSRILVGYSVEALGFLDESCQAVGPMPAPAMVGDGLRVLRDTLYKLAPSCDTGPPVQAGPTLGGEFSADYGGCSPQVAEVQMKEESFVVVTKQEASDEGVLDAAAGLGPETQSPAGRSREDEVAPGAKESRSEDCGSQKVDLEGSTDGSGDDRRRSPERVVVGRRAVLQGRDRGLDLKIADIPIRRTAHPDGGTSKRCMEAREGGAPGRWTGRRSCARRGPGAMTSGEGSRGLRVVKVFLFE